MYTVLLFFKNSNYLPCWVNLHAFAGLFCMHLLPSADFFSKKSFSKNSLSNTIRMSNGLNTDQDQCSVGPDLGPMVAMVISRSQKKSLPTWKE